MNNPDSDLSVTLGRQSSFCCPLKTCAQDRARSEGVLLTPKSQTKAKEALGQCGNAGWALIFAGGREKMGTTSVCPPHSCPRVSCRPKTSLCDWILPVSCVHVTPGKTRSWRLAPLLTCPAQNHLCILWVIDKETCLEGPHPARESTRVLFHELFQLLHVLVLKKLR